MRRHRMKQMKRRRLKSEHVHVIVNQIADGILVLAVLLLISGAIPGVFILYTILKPENVFMPTPLPLYCAPFLFGGGGVFLIFLAREFRHVKGWTYDIVRHLIRSVNIFLFTGLRQKIDDRELRRAFHGDEWNIDD